MRKKIIVSGVAVFLVLLIATGIWWLFSTGRLVFNANPSSQTASSSAVCGTDVVNAYNTVSYYQIRSGASIPTLDEVGLKKLVAEIKTKNGYVSDPTCQSILFLSAVHEDDYTAAKPAYDAVKNLHDKGIFADSNIRANNALFVYESMLNGLTTAPSQTGGSGQ